MRRFLGAASFATVLAWAGNLAWAEGPLNLETPTMGGMQFWTDQLWFHQWRIQKHAETGHYRLLDGAQVRRAWGSFAHCRAELDRYKRELELPPMQGKAVILLHGMGRSRASMQGLARYLAKDGYEVFNLSYSSTRHPIENHAAALASVVENLDGFDEIHLIGHSLGNVVIRHYLGDTTDEVTGRQGDPRIARIVMLAPPNHPPQMAKIFGRNKAFELLVGPSGQQLAHWDELEPRLAAPACPFGIIAGSYGQGTDWNCFLEGDHDLIVTVAETRLAGARDFSLVPCFHTFIMDHPQVQSQTLRFLKFGNFVSDEQRQPIERPMKIYLDVSCLNRPFDDQSQARIRLEAEAVALVMERMDLGDWQQVSSEMATLEVEAIGDPERKERVQALLQDVEIVVKLTNKEFSRAAILEKLGFKAGDALHVAAAETAAADVLLSCDADWPSVCEVNC